jgi:outer membrane protein assembly factor BamB/protein-L-isoaspartate O-methyltransferase
MLPRSWSLSFHLVGLVLIGFAHALPSLRADEASPAQPLAEKILAAAGVRGGIVAHLGCGDGRLTAALRAGNAFTIHALERNPALVQTAREHIANVGQYGPVSVEHWARSTLPYADNLINLVVINGPSAVERTEILRVLAPGGTAVFSSTGREPQITDVIVKPRPDTIDQWTHFLHDAGNNAVARDTQVGPPRCLQWVAPPLWLRSHETPSGIEGLVSSDRRIFYFLDEGLIGITDQRLPERWSLVCRDAFNGRLLWKRTVEPWGWPEWARDKFIDQDWTEIRSARTVVPSENQRRLVADGDRLYATLGFQAPLAILDAASGEVLAVVKGTSPTKEILASDGIVVVHCSDPSASAAKRRGKEEQKTSRLVAVQGDTGAVRWSRETQAISPLQLVIDGGRVVYRAGSTLTALSLADGRPQWSVDGVAGKARTLIGHDGVVLQYVQNTLEARDGASGDRLWRQDVPPSTGGESEDLFVADGVAWRGMMCVDENEKPVGKSAGAMAIGFDLRTGEEKKRIVVPNLRSPEHHHRCYRNKATERYLISGMEGAEFMDLLGDDHGQNNWLRGACKLGVMPCNGLLYVPADQCFCQPGAKLLGFTAVAAESPSRYHPLPDAQRLERGPAWERTPDLKSEIQNSKPKISNRDDWPTFRHDPARHGSTASAVDPRVAVQWQTRLGGRLTAPVAAGGRVYVALTDAHTIAALDAKTGEPVWKYVAGGRIDSPPTIHEGLALFGSADGRVYCVRANDGELVWRFLAAPMDCRIGSFDQLESAWPVHGSVLVRDGVAYVTAGRSTYLDGGIRLYALDPKTGKVLHQTVLEGPFPDVETARDVAFYVPGANSDVLVSEGDHLYLRQKKLTPDLREVSVPVLSSKGEQDVGRHVFSTAGLLDDSRYNRTFWMYAERWPGFQLANQSPKTGQLLVVDDAQTYAVQPFYRRNVHSLMFFPGKEGYLLYADRNENEPQIVGEPGARKPVEWLPQSHIPRDGNPGLDSPAFGLDKMIGYTRAEPPLWARFIPIRIRAMVKAGSTLFIAGPPDELDPADPYAAFEGRRGARLAAVSAADGTELAKLDLDSPPVFDGLIAAGGRLFVTLENGTLACLGQ